MSTSEPNEGPGVLAVISTPADCRSFRNCCPAWLGITVSYVLPFFSVPLAWPSEPSVTVFT